MSGLIKFLKKWWADGKAMTEAAYRWHDEHNCQHPTCVARRKEAGNV